MPHRNTTKFSTGLALASLMLSSCSSDAVNLYKSLLPGRSTESTLIYAALAVIGTGAEYYADSLAEKCMRMPQNYCNDEDAKKAVKILRHRTEEAQKLATEYAEHISTLQDKLPKPSTSEILETTHFLTKEQASYVFLLEEEEQAVYAAKKAVEPYKTTVDPELSKFLCSIEDLKQQRRKLNNLLDKAIKAHGLAGWCGSENCLSLLNYHAPTPAAKNRQYHKVIAQRLPEIAEIRTFLQQNTDTLSQKNSLLTKDENQIVTQSIALAVATLRIIADEITQITRGGDDKSLEPELKKLRMARDAAFTQYQQLCTLLSELSEKD